MNQREGAQAGWHFLLVEDCAYIQVLMNAPLTGQALQFCRPFFQPSCARVWQLFCVGQAPQALHGVLGASQH